MEVAEGIDLHGFAVDEIERFLRETRRQPTRLVEILVDLELDLGSEIPKCAMYAFRYEMKRLWGGLTNFVTRDEVLASSIAGNYLPIGVI